MSSSRRSAAVLSAVLLLCSLGSAEAYNYYLSSSFIDHEGNLALGRDSFQSSTRHGGDASRAVDGGISGNWYDYTCTHTDKQGDSSWWTVELAETTAIKLLQIYNRVDDGAERLLGVEIRAGDNEVDSDGDGTDNEVCEHYAEDDDPTAGDESINDDDYIPTRFRFANCTGKYVTVRLPTREYLSICEVMVFSNDKPTQYTLDPVLPTSDDGATLCPAPLADEDGNPSCEPKDGETQDQAYVRAYMEGPINCGGKGFFCRMKEDHAGIEGGVTGTPGDQLLNNRNYGYCVDRAEDRQINWNSLSRQPNNNDGHCHGSDIDASYIGVLHDHYYRPYRGDLECCCGMESRDGDNKWIPALNYISRCDYRGADQNDADQNYEDGCSRDMNAFIPKEAFPAEDSMCWTMKNFGKPPANVYEKPPYTRPEVDVPFCQDAGNEAESSTWAGCLVRINARHFAHTVVMVSPSIVPARYIDDIEGCDNVYGVELSEKGLQIWDMDDLDAHGHETDFLRVELPEGQTTAFFQVMDTSQCGLSAVVEAPVPSSGVTRKMMRKMLGLN
eukprot:CAMPEP_0177767740 /NCGR_PEP_ID=MMETSP0491_2-20121128/9306_1 /TAXON_ID=63592 /ORGANISM="Tetraselmis chuii, Strain PLY429" /LENGTH=556 /DNA_ID=CAMNT_0019284415 /DNA_START=184 /DNA_END=1854 /DNA_ORIENTATION=+